MSTMNENESSLNLSVPLAVSPARSRRKVQYRVQHDKLSSKKSPTKPTLH